ncbi:hypothetical protein N0V88_008001 [Collariella sp. IMI 366227]|nr:hypothetical protein N0V88_008001 [Collariella sp. IMI 366227]
MNTQAAKAPEACTLTNSIPGCGITCLLNASNEAGCSNPFDLTCQCKAAEQIRSFAAPCVKSKCDEKAASSVESVARAICTECAH